MRLYLLAILLFAYTVSARSSGYGFKAEEASPLNYGFKIAHAIQKRNASDTSGVDPLSEFFWILFNAIVDLFYTLYSWGMKLLGTTEIGLDIFLFVVKVLVIWFIRQIEYFLVSVF